MTAYTEVEAESYQQGDTALDWTRGWEPSPATHLTGGPHFSIGASGFVRDPSYRGCRDTYISQNIRRYRHVPGPGAHRVPREFPMLDKGDEGKGGMHSGRFGDSFSCALGQTAQAQFLSSTRHGRHHLKDGEDVDQRRTRFTRAASFTLTRTPNNRSFRSLSQGKLHPSSFYTPGPGAYTQHSTFGAPSGGIRTTNVRASHNGGFTRHPCPNAPKPHELKVRNNKKQLKLTMSIRMDQTMDTFQL